MRFAIFSNLCVLGFIGYVSSEVFPAPNPTFPANAGTEWSGVTVGNSRKALVYVPFTAADGSADMISVTRLDLIGTDYERGYAHGYLLAKG